MVIIKKENTVYLPLIALLIAVLYSFYKVNTTNIVLGTKQYSGIAFFAVSLLLTIAKRNTGIYFTGITLLLGVFNIVIFTPTNRSEHIGFSFENGFGLDFRVQMLSFWISLLYLLVNYRALYDSFENYNKKRKNKAYSGQGDGKI